MSERGNFETAYPLSPLQEGLLFHALYAPQEGMYLDQLSWLLDDPDGLDVAAFRNAWRKVVERHAVLRTAFSWKRRGSPLQVVLRRVEVPLTELDWTACPEAEQGERLQAFLDEDRRRGFDFARPPLLRVALIRLAERAWRCVLTYHHVLMDAWSLALVLRELFAYYGALRQRRDLQLPLPRPYAEYIAWLGRQSLARAEAFWRRELAGFSAPTRLWVDTLPRGAGGDEGYASRTVLLSPEATAALNGLARRHRLTVNNLLQAGWGLLLSRYSAERDVVFGVTVSGRPDDLPGGESMVGLFINTLPFRVRVRPDARLIPWAQEIQARQVELRQLEHSPLVEIQGWSEVPRSLPLFETILVFESSSMLAATEGSPESRGIGVRDLTYDPKSNYAVSLMVAPGARLSLRILYSCSRLDAPSVGRMLGHLAALLEAMPRAADERLSELPLFSPAERAQLVVQWQDTATGAVRRGSIHDLFARQAERDPEAVAILCEDETVTYGELRRWSNRLASHLRSLVGPRALVGILLDRSAGMVAAVLGVLEAGCAYVPVDIGFPAARQRWILGSLEVPCVITESALLAGVRGLAPELPALHHVICLDEPAREPGSPFRLWTRADLERRSGGEPLPSASPEDLAYIIFTSGSTGNPKGVMLLHEPVINIIDWINRTFDIGPADRVLFIASLTFDLSVYDIFGILAAGGAIRVVSSAEVREPRQLLRRMLDEPITLWDSAPAALQQLAAFLDEAGERGGGEPPALQVVLLSGDWIPVTLPDRVRAVFSRARIAALGGGTEAAIWSNHYPVGEVDPRWVSIPYGRPTQNARYLILDEALSPCPIGVPGDLYIGGHCLASGYAGEPALTAGKFVPDPFTDESGARLYRTGDHARFWPNGLIEFLGRIDQQVKIRGYRIELGEIQFALSRHPALREAVVVARQDRGGERCLVAYVVPRPGQEVHAGRLRAFLAESLPEPMLPAAFVFLDALPVTSNGKLDHRALPDPFLEGDVGQASEAPRTPVEELLSGIWSEVLGGRPVGIHDNFFELGGHSLRAAQVISRVRETFGTELSLRSLFAEPTVARLARRIEEARADGAEGPVVERLAERSAAPLSFTQQRLWFLEQMAAGDPAYQIPFAMRFQGGPLEIGALDASLAAVVRRHESLRTTFVTVDDEPVQVVSPAGESPLLLVDLTGLPEPLRERVAREIVREQVRCPFDLARGPLLRVSLIRLTPAEHVLVLTLHHIVSDAWSMGILFRELTQLYPARVAGHALALPDLSYQYIDYADWQRRLLRPEALEAQLAYWRRQLAEAPVAPELPGARSEAASSLRGGTEPFVLSSELSAAVRELGRKEGVTLFMVLLAGLSVLLHHYSGDADVVVGTNVANRHRGEFEGVIGAFVNTLALRVSLSGVSTFQELLGKVREVALGAYAHQDVPFERIVEDLRSRRAVGSDAPLFRVMLVLQDVPGSASAELPGITLQPVDLERRSANFDLTLFLYTDRERLAGTLEYRSGLYDRADMRRLLDHFAALLEKAVERPAVQLADLSPAREAVLEGFSDDLEDS